MNYPIRDGQVKACGFDRPICLCLPRLYGKTGSVRLTGVSLNFSPQLCQVDALQTYIVADQIRHDLTDNQPTKYSSHLTMINSKVGVYMRVSGQHLTYTPRGEPWGNSPEKKDEFMFT